MKSATINNPVYEKPLRKGHSLAIVKNKETDIIQVRNAKGISLFTIEVTDQGTNLTIAAQNININAEKKLNLSAEEITIKSKKEILINSDGNFKRIIKGEVEISTEGTQTNEAKIQIIKARLGDVKLLANDDVRLNGERVLLNSD